ncbi:NACHT, LRR and PYD domains-containing protein 12-like [Colossoma macropomum]|uniref:NACHT, LRR and PYD domains-containing protein 12-like n=1 Tax=Colossoma macropomum TaxID=42526 RepID=UPI001863E208|nr:NACHT, LRR and PYD domains-containing protein 12-like [Colossoma macropomum]
MKSDRSMENSPDFSSGGGEPSCVSEKSDWSMMFPAPSSGGRGSSDSGQHSTQTALQINTLADIHQPVDDVLHRVLERHKTSMKNKYESLFEGIRTEENKTLLNRIYTQLYIIEGESEGVNEEHEVLQMEKTPRRRLQDSPINCLDIFKPLQGPEGETREETIRAVKADRLRHREREDNRPEEPELRAVLTKGIAGIGKTVSVQKFILDWAEGKANQDVELMFVLPFRELNLIKDDQYSLHGLLCDFHPELKDLDPTIYDQIKAVFIFDGLDESRIPLNFEQCGKVSDITMTSSVDVLMTNLIKGDLLPSALIWITSRPAAANQIPPQYINRVTEIQGFSDPQKEEYFRKRISDEDQAQRIISHIKTVRSLHIMCHIPVFCWISATVLQQIMKQRHTEIPKILTEMYSHFLITQTNMKNEKYEEKDERDPKNLLESNRTVLLKLAELAFKQLMKGNVMFYEEDLRESSIDVTEASVYSGIFTEIFREECVLHQRKVYCFVHLSFQEFLAAVYVFHWFDINKEELQCFMPVQYSEWSEDDPLYSEWSEDVPLDEVLKAAVNKAVKSPNGHLDLFLRFLLGISLESNQRCLQGLLTPTQSSSERTREHIKSLIKGDNYRISTKRSINLFLCLSEMNDQSLSREIQKYLNSERHSEETLSPGQCSALAYMLLTSEEVLDELDLKKYSTSEEGYRRLIPALTVCRKARLNGSYITKNFCETLCLTLQSVNSSLKDLDLSNNDMQNSGVELLSAGLKNSHCKLEILRLVRCSLTTNSCEKLSSALQSANSSLKELDLSNNDLQDSGVELLCAGLKNSHCKLEILRLVRCSFTTNSCEKLSSALQSANSSLKELDLSNNDLQDSGVELLCTGLKNSHCKLEILRLVRCSFTTNSCEKLSSALQSANSSLKELDLSNNDLQDSGVELLCAGLKNSHCKMEVFRLNGSYITKNFCETLCLTLQSVNSSLKELDLSNNDLQNSGVELLSAGLKNSHCKLEILRLASCSLTTYSCEELSSALQSANSSQKELDLSNNDLKDSGVELLSAGLKNSNCKLEMLRLSGCMVTSEGCYSLASALKSNPSHLRELDLTYNHPGESGVKLLSDLLEDPHCKLEKLQVDHGGKIRIKPGLKKYAVNLTLDPNTVNRNLSLSERNRKVETKWKDQSYPDHPDRFDSWPQVLSVESLTGRCYWEVQWSGNIAVLSVSSRRIGRKGSSDDCVFARNNLSWTLNCVGNSYSFWHKSQKTDLPAPPSPSNRVGVYLDWESGTVSFYSVSPKTHTLTHLHTLFTTFTEPLYTGFFIYEHVSMSLCEIE